MKLVRRGGVVYLQDRSGKDIIGMTPMEAEWFSQEMRHVLTSEFCVQLHLAASEADKETLQLNPTTKEYPLKRG